MRERDRHSRSRRSTGIAALAAAALLGAAPLAAPVAAQPTLGPGDLLAIGDTAVRELHVGPIDVSALTAPGPMGSWDFTGIAGPPLFSEVLEMLPVGAGIVDAGAFFPGADRALRITSPPGDPFPAPPFWEYYGTSGGGRTFHGYAVELPPSPIVEPTSSPTVDIALPLALGAQWSEGYSIGMPLINELTIDHTVDAWGTAVIPGLGPVECLRVTSEIANALSDASGGGPPVPLGTMHTRTYSWFAAGLGLVARVGSEPDPIAAAPPGFTTAADVFLLVEHVPAPSGPAFVRGDANGDGAVDLGDPVSALMASFGDPVAICEAAADFDDDGALDLADVIGALEHLFGAGPPPATPHAACGADPTPDLPCAVSPCP